MSNRDDFIKVLKKEHSDMKVMFLSKTKSEIWPREKILKDLTAPELEQFNLRKQKPDEMILDIEEKSSYQKIKEELNSKKWSYEVWDTGSRGIHISILFTNLADKPVELRNRIRKYIIDIFDTDDKLAKETQWMALEWTPHFKTGKRKELYEVVKDGDNEVSNHIIEYCEQQLEQSKKQVEQSDEDFKDFFKTDPYLKYALENKILNGGRDYILFKNLAIGLVKSGLTHEQIVKFATAIATNCPGKSPNEFMGWVDKAMDGEMTYYNRDELIQWSLTYGHPPLYKRTEELDELLSIKQLWDTLWNNSIAVQPVWKDLCFYNMVGTIVDERTEDMRIHVIFQSYSTTGKDEGLNIIETVLKKLNYLTSRPAEITDRTLLGSVNQTAIEENTKHGVSEDNPIEGRHTYKAEIEEGILGTAHWMAFGEAEPVFKPGVHNRLIQVILRQAMDKNRQIEKGVGGRRIILNTNTSFILTTYTMENTIYNILSNGLFQRSLFYNKDTSSEDHKIIRKHINRKEFNSNIKLNFNPETYMQLMIDKLRTMKIWYDEHRLDFTTFDGCDKYTDGLWDAYERKYKSLMPMDINIMNSIIRRAAKNLKKLATLRAVWNTRTVITKEDVDESFELLKICVESVKEMILKQNKVKKREYGVLFILKEGTMTKGNLYNEMAEQLSIKSPNAQVAEINKLKDLEWVTVFKEGRYEMVGLTDKGRVMIDAKE